jgi:glycosyltransferase involved in cell wall biosynthesis
MLNIIRNRPSIVIHEMSLSMLNVYLMPLIARIFSIRLIWWGHGFNRMDKDGKKILRRQIRILLHKMADASIVYSSKGKNFLASHGVKQYKIFIAWNAIDTQTFEQIKNSMPRTNNKPGVSFVFLGRLTEGKKPLLAAELFKRLASKYPKCKFHFIGSGPYEKQLREIFSSGRWNNVFIYGDISDPYLLSLILSNCDLMVCPGYLGLNIAHAIAFSIPVISVKDGIDNTFHSPEIEYIENTKAIIELENSDIHLFENCCTKFIENKELLSRAKKAAGECSKNISISRMLDGFRGAIEYTLEAKGLK